MFPSADLQFTALYSHAATFEPSFVRWPTDFTINARCDDPSNLCRCDVGDTEAYTRNSGGSNGNGVFMNFCPEFFTQPNLGAKTNRQLTAVPTYKFDVDEWNNQGQLPSDSHGIELR